MHENTQPDAPAKSVIRGSTCDVPTTRVSRLFEEKLPVYRKHVAAVADNTSFTFELLNAQANIVARSLVQRMRDDDFPCGTFRHDEQRLCVVALLMTPSVHRFIAVLAVLKAGATYLPLDATFPERRIKWMVKQSRARALITHSPTPYLHNIVTVLAYGSLLSQPTLTTDLLHTDLLDIEELDTSKTEHAVAVLLYTSGTTGRPKLVPVTHYSILCTLPHVAGLVDIQDGSMVLQASLSNFLSIAFPVEMFSGLLYGRCLVVFPEPTMRDASLFLAHVREQHVNYILSVTPTFLASLLLLADSQAVLRRLVCVGVGAELVPVTLLRDFLARCTPCKLVVIWGMSESTMFSIRCVYASLDDLQSNTVDGKAALGAPIPNLHVYIVDQLGHVVDEGEVGEIALSGPVVTKGYIATSDKSPFITLAGERCFLTGDYGFMKKGRVYFSGRHSSRLKVRGYTVSAAEVDHVVRSVPGVSAAATIGHVLRADDVIVVTFYTCCVAQQVSEMEVAARCRAHLPAYALPRLFRLHAMPVRAPQMKIDYPALHAMFQAYIHAQETDSCGSLTLASVRTIVARSLTVPVHRVTAHGNFFALGGNSANAVCVWSELSQRGYTGTLSQFLSTPTIGQLVQSAHIPMKPAQTLSELSRKPRELIQSLENSSKHSWDRNGPMQQLKIPQGIGNSVRMQPPDNPRSPMLPSEPSENPKGLIQPSENPKGSVQPSENPRGPTQPSKNPKEPIQPSENPQGPTQPSENPQGPMQPPDNPRGPIQPSENPKGPTQPSDNPKGPTQPSENPKGSVQPSENPQGPTQPSDNPKGSVQASKNPRGPTQPSDNPKGSVQASENPRGPTQPSDNPKGSVQASENPRGPIQAELFGTAASRMLCAASASDTNFYVQPLNELDDDEHPVVCQLLAASFFNNRYKLFKQLFPYPWPMYEQYVYGAWPEAHRDGMSYVIRCTHSHRYVAAGFLTSAPISSPHADTTLIDSIHSDTTRTDSVHSDTTRTDSIHSDTTRTDSIHSDTARTDSVHSDKTVIDAPATDARVIDAPATDGPVIDGPATDGPVIDGPATNGRVMDAPATDGPVIDGPATDGRVMDAPATDGPVIDGPATDGPVIDRPGTDVPVIDGPATNVPVIDAPGTDGPVIDGPGTDGPVIDAPATDGPVIDGPVTDGPVIDGPVTDGPVIDAPATDGPVIDGPVTDGPVIDGPGSSERRPEGDVLLEEVEGPFLAAYSRLPGRTLFASRFGTAPDVSSREASMLSRLALQHAVTVATTHGFARLHVATMIPALQALMLEQGANIWAKVQLCEFQHGGQRPYISAPPDACHMSLVLELT